MSETVQSLVTRLKMVLPVRWFADSAPNLDILLTGLAAAWLGLFELLDTVSAQKRLATASGIFLDMAARDYLGTALPRRAAEADGAYSLRIRRNVLRSRATRASTAQALTDLTGRTPCIFEPRNPADTGGYNFNTGYGVAGGYGNLNMPYQFFVIAYRPNQLPVSNGSGYCLGPGGYNAAPAFYADTSEFQGNISDSEICTSIAAVLPTAAIAWTAISN